MRTGNVLRTGVLVLPLALFGETLLYDDLNDGNRLNQNLPYSAHWIHSSPDESRIWLKEVEPGNWATVINENTNPYVIDGGIHAYFTPEGEPASITGGRNILRYSFHVTPENDPAYSSDGFRVALLNTGSGGVRYTTDTWADPGGGHPIDSGYGLFINPQTGRVQFKARTIADHGPLSVEAYTIIADVNPEIQEHLGSFQMTGGTTSYVVVELERLSDGNVQISTVLIDSETFQVRDYSCIDDTYKFTEFDTIAIAQRSFSGETMYDNHDVYMIPEPATIGMLGLGSLLALWIRRLKS